MMFNVELTFVFQLVALGATVGLLAGLLGVGGGGIMVPMLTTLFILQQIASGHEVHLALGTSMASIIMTTFSSALSHHKNHNIDWQYVKTMSPFIILGSLLMSFAIPFIDTFYLALFFSVFMTHVSLKLLFGKQQNTSKLTPIPQIAGLGIGGISTIVAIGGAAFTVPYLVARGVHLKRAIGSSAAIGLPIALAGSVGYAINGLLLPEPISDSPYVLGFIHIPSVLIISFCGFVMAPVGVRLSGKLQVATLKKILAILLIGLSAKMLFNVLLN